ncbi:hypothetical protein ACOMICROBIO_GDFFDHBD_04121 (plasmid) [Vibrio sp. B1REV9]|uniref:MBL fold metallo-hydrolase n=1 Tax=Vibrio sp. B1REV9 TaxID=2751179 RepID=UPI001AEC8434|nr:MBL fold metallo-hydrolase [Vibrio sp. B1REV9]CAE6958674.1 hypothetical protein ACOMICROBIO_GDFFDHBD_04121 [Vibrio sp. B1REV9]
MTIERLQPVKFEPQEQALRYILASTEFGVLVPVSDGIYLLRMPMDLGLDHINVYLLEDNDGWYVVDTGLASDKVRDIWTRIAVDCFANKPLKGLICTHFHYDHASLADWLMKTFNIPLYMTSGEYLWMRTLAESRQKRVKETLNPFYLSHGVPSEVIDKILAMVEQDTLSALYPTKYCRVREGDVFTIGERSWRVIIGEGHSPEHICLYHAQDGLLIAGDQLLPDISSSIFVNEIEPDADPLRGWLASLNKLSALPDDTQVLPSHGGLFVGIQQRSKELHTLHQKRLNRLLDTLKDQGDCSLYQLMRSLFSREMNAMNTMLALGETAAHINYLLNKKKLEKQISADKGEITYRLTFAIDSLT